MHRVSTSATNTGLPQACDIDARGDVYVLPEARAPML